MNREINIDIQYTWNLFVKQDGKCALTGVDIRIGDSRYGVEYHNASLDRKDNSKGHIKGND